MAELAFKAASSTVCGIAERRKQYNGNNVGLDEAVENKATCVADFAEQAAAVSEGNADGFKKRTADAAA
eukprot:4586559-Pleurochrysis_carterae.AAC.1